jgi:hypothetical protein
MSASKLLIRDGTAYLFGGKPRKMGRLEMLGGGLESGEAPFEALLRELREEESSGALEKLARERAPAPLTIVAEGRTDFIFRIDVEKLDLGSLVAAANEVTTLALVARSTIEDPEALKPNRKLFTRRTWKLFEAMGFL